MNSGILLAVSVILSLLLANSPLAEPLSNFLALNLGIDPLRYSVLLWINDGLMAIFFLLVGLEIKREMVAGELSSPKKALLPILAAIGGAILPALIYVGINWNQETASGWGIPMATDIAFALAVISLLGNRVPASLKIFLAALAIVDDLLAILVIAIFYSGDLHTSYLFYALGIWLALMVLNRLGVKSLYAYLIPGLFIWYFIHHSGIHATIAGVLVAIAIPYKTSSSSPLLALEHALVKPVNWIIIPIFAFANTNITIHSEMLEGLFSPLGLGILAGLLIGKSVGIFSIAWITKKIGICDLPEGANWAQVYGVGLLAGIGFTMSIFIAILSFADIQYVEQAKLAILIASVIAGALGYFLLSRKTKAL